MHLVGAGQAGADAVVGVGLHWVEVEHKDQVAALHDYQLVALVLTHHATGSVSTSVPSRMDQGNIYEL